MDFFAHNADEADHHQINLFVTVCQSFKTSVVTSLCWLISNDGFSKDLLSKAEMGAII